MADPGKYLKLTSTLFETKCFGKQVRFCQCTPEDSCKAPQYAVGGGPTCVHMGACSRGQAKQHKEQDFNMLSLTCWCIFRYSWFILELYPGKAMLIMD